MTAVVDYFRRVRSRQVVRPWALCTPIVVLLIALPLLRPLRSPGSASEHELSRLATIQALVEHDTQAINDSEFFGALRRGDGLSNDATRPAGAWLNGDLVPGTIQVGTRYYSDKPPVLSFLLSKAYRVMYWLGLDFQHNPTLVPYLLTLLGVTLPVAGGAGLVYRMGRMFELPRPYRTGLALIVALGSGLISYATVLNPHAPAAALVLCACSCLIHVNNSGTPSSSGAWLMMAGLCAAFAAVIDPTALAFFVLLPLVVLAFSWNWGMRIGGVVLFAIGTSPAILMHAALMIPITGDIRPGFLHVDLGGGQHPGTVAASAATEDIDDGAPRPAAWKVALFRGIDRAFGALVGGKGLLTHFPVVIMGILGMNLVLRRHWPGSTKVLAAVTLTGMLAIITAYTLLRADWTQAMFGPRWFVVFIPVALFWSGAWLRRAHSKLSWALAGVLLLFSVGVSLIGATAPFVRSSPGQYTVAVAVKKMIHGDQPARNSLQVVAGR